MFHIPLHEMFPDPAHEIFPIPAHATVQSPPGGRSTPRYHPFHRKVDDEFAVRRYCLQLSSAFRDFYAGNTTDYSYDDLHSCAYRVVCARRGEMLYTLVATTMSAEVEKLAASLDHSAPDAEFLRELLARWKKHSDAAAMIVNVLIYFTRVFVEARGKAPVRELGLRAWRDGVLRRPAGARLRDTLLDVARRERAGQAVDVTLRELMAGATKMLLEGGDGLYEEVFEAPFLEETRVVCASESARLLASPWGCGEYLLVRAVQPMVNAEKARVSRYLDARTEEKVTAVVLKEMVQKNVTRLVGMEGSGLAAMLEDGRYWDLTRMHRLLRRVQGGMQAMTDGMQVYFQEIRNAAGDNERLLSREKERCREMIDGVFHGEVSFHAALDSCFT
ncbi:unnamed protein product [Alopecurus aequalis]